MPQFSIIIPVYNVAPYLRECLDSVLAQTFTDWEAICVDDGSTDGSGAILDEYREKVEKLGGGGQRTGKIVVIHQQNAGVSAARNAALDVAKGAYVGFLDGDDVWNADWLRVVAGAIDDHKNVDWIRLGFTRWNGGAWPQITIAGRATFYDSEVPSLLWNEVCRLGYGFMNFYRRECIGAQRFKVGLKISEDTLFALGLAKHLKTAAVVPYSGYLYRQREGSALVVRSQSLGSVRFMWALVNLWRMAFCGQDACAFKKVCLRSVMFRAGICMRRWLMLCDDITIRDRFQMWMAFLELWLMGGFSFRELSGKEKIAWSPFLLIGNTFLLKKYWKFSICQI